MRIVVTGASGLLGPRFVDQMRGAGHEVLRLVRRAPASADERTWDPAAGRLDPAIFEGVDAVVHLSGVARKIADLAERTRTNQVTPDELGGGTFTITNTGSRGALFDTPIINQPQVGILGTGAVVKRPVVVSDPELGEVVAVRSMAYLALTYDHRIVDGADAARFLTTVKERLEQGDFAAELGL